MLNFHNKKFLVYGFGISGNSCFKYLKKNKYFVKVYDDISKNNITNKNFLLKKKDINRIKFDYIVLSPGINYKNCKLKSFLKKNKNKIINELDLFYQNYKNNKIITITGTNGKSTTVKLVYDILKYCKKDVRLTGNIGKPMLNAKNINHDTIFIIEASSYQIDYSKFFKTDIAIILNISPDHLERHNTFLNYAKIKFKLIKNQNSDGIAIIENNSHILEKLIKKNRIKSKIIRINKKIYLKLKSKITNKIFDSIDNQSNLVFALEICKILRLKTNVIIKSLNIFKSLPYRQQIIFNSNKLLVMNDSKSTSFSSSIGNLKSFKNIYWIMGGLAKKGDKFTLDSKYRKNIKAYVYGKDKFFFSKQLSGKIIFKKFKNIEEILKKIIIDTKNDNFKKFVIFSPAAASFDKFKNFEKRGEDFNLTLKKTNFIKKINDKRQVI